jgi:lipopolysaccharide assembly outer membrane protein LptD (OstA)
MSQRVADSTKPGKTIVIITADKYHFEDKDTSGKFVSLVGHAKVRQEKTLFEADSIVLNQKDNILEAFGNVHINDADTVNTYSQYLKYLGKEKKAYLNKDVKLTDGKGVLTTNDLEYDTQFKIGKYTNGGKVVNKKTVITSKEGYYYGETGDVYFKLGVNLKDPEFKINTDTLLYNTNKDLATFVCPTTIINGKKTIKTSDGFYELKKKKANFGKRPFVDDSTYTFTADQMAFDDSTGQGEAQGNAVYRSKDSVGGYDIIANNIKLNNKNNAFLATQKPILFIKQKKDTIYVSADTLYSAKITDLKKSRVVPFIRDTIKLDTVKTRIDKPDSAHDRFFEAYYHVKIYSDSLQAVGDSLFYSMEDSTFRLLKNPVAWAQENQISGDTIYLYLENKRPQRLKVFENALAVSKEYKDYFNQVRGNTMYAFFKEGKINFMRTKGSPAENIYYAKDDNKKFVGVNKCSSDLIEISFDDGKPQRVRFINNLEGTMYPLQQVNHKELRVRKFKWLEDIRPKSKFDILIF